MKTLPSSASISHRSTVRPDFGIEIDRPSGGAAAVRELFDTTTYRLEIVWESVTTTQSESILWFLRETVAWKAVLHGHDYAVRLVGSPRIDRLAPNRFNVTAPFQGTRL